MPAGSVSFESASVCDPEVDEACMPELASFRLLASVCQYQK